MSFVIGLDLDGVAYDWDSTARYMLRRRYVETGRESSIPSALFYPSKSWDWIMDAVHPQDWAWLWSTAIEDGLYRYGHVITGAIEGVQALNELGDVTVITSRPKAAVHDTLVWLTTMFDKAPLAGLTIQSHRDQKKSDVTPRPDVYIDDGAHNISDILAATDRHAIVFDQPWNQGLEVIPVFHKRLVRAYGWRDVVNSVRDIKDRVDG